MRGGEVEKAWERDPPPPPARGEEGEGYVLVSGYIFWDKKEKKKVRNIYCALCLLMSRKNCRGSNGMLRRRHFGHSP